jgi:hypothetical protein
MYLFILNSLIYTLYFFDFDVQLHDLLGKNCHCNTAHFFHVDCLCCMFKEPINDIKGVLYLLLHLYSQKCGFISQLLNCSFNIL